MKFYCHSCRCEFEDVLPNFLCSRCHSGCVEEMINGATSHDLRRGLPVRPLRRSLRHHNPIFSSSRVIVQDTSYPVASDNNVEATSSLVNAPNVIPPVINPVIGHASYTSPSLLRMGSLQRRLAPSRVQPMRAVRLSNNMNAPAGSSSGLHVASGDASFHAPMEVDSDSLNAVSEESNYGPIPCVRRRRVRSHYLAYPPVSSNITNNANTNDNGDMPSVSHNNNIDANSTLTSDAVRPFGLFIPNTTPSDVNTTPVAPLRRASRQQEAGSSTTNSRHRLILYGNSNNSDDADDDMMRFIWGFLESGGRRATIELSVDSNANSDYVFGETAFQALLARFMTRMESDGVPAATSTQIQGLPIVQVTLAQLDAHVLCSICRDEFKLSDTLKELSCQHCFHPECIDAWLTRHASCPLCRQTLPAGDDINEDVIV